MVNNHARFFAIMATLQRMVFMAFIFVLALMGNNWWAMGMAALWFFAPTPGERVPERPIYNNLKL